MATVREDLPTAVRRIQPADYELSTIQDALASAVDKILTYLNTGGDSSWLGPLWLNDAAVAHDTWTALGLGAANRGYTHRATFAHHLLGGNYTVHPGSAAVEFRVQDTSSNTTLWQPGGTVPADSIGTWPTGEWGQRMLAADTNYCVQVRQTTGGAAPIYCAVSLHVGTRT